MAYSANITQNNRQTIIFLIDQSGSMNENITWCGNLMTKAEAVTDVVNNALGEIVARCNNYGQYKSYFNIAVIGYGGNGVKSLLGEGRQVFFTPSELGYGWKRNVEVINVRKLPNGKECATKVNKKVWIEPHAEGKTPMFGAFNYVFDLLAASIAQECAKDCFPPIVINVTDGEATDCNENELDSVTQRVKNLATNDGNVLLMNVHIGGSEDDSIIFPSHTNCPLQSKFARLLFNVSSVMPEFFEREIIQICNNEKPFKAFAYNASIGDLVRMVNIGSSSSMLIV